MDEIIFPIKKIVKDLKPGSKLYMPYSLDGNIETYTVKTIKNNPKLNHPSLGKFYEVTLMENDDKLWGYENNTFVHFDGGAMGENLLTCVRLNIKNNMTLDKYKIGWWNCFISLYYETIGKQGEDIVDIIINVARSERVTKEEIDDIIQYYDDTIGEEVLNFLKRLKEFI